MNKSIIGVIAVSLFLVVALPALVINLWQSEPRISIKNVGPGIRVKMDDTGKVVVMPLEEYLVGVVAAEMPASFYPQALAAQAVAARTYTLKKLTNSAASALHPNADVCTDSNHCQGWLSKIELRRRWGIVKYWSYYKKIVDAVQDTQGMVLTYGGRLIEPVYHSTSGGRTEASSEVWKYSFPYLQSVECKWDKRSPRYFNKETITISRLEQKLGVNIAAAPVMVGSDSPLRILERTVSGRVKTIKVGSKTFAGTDFRRLLGLSSTYIDWEISGGSIIFNTKGYGHGVGLCQYGADGQARQGKDYREILKYYYRGVAIEKYQ